ncbi:hypothetical protein Ddye_029246 [Dipteronia dyeriana]|uniref:Protein BCCIP homolog n=1 Tax=Dipteronia dyeriana TaxID=168575 RepID=A0AAD9WKE8_9ROSI|nr:hypothetical protein Ddye_029246 [Dipteronia dyeriana]
MPRRLTRRRRLLPQPLTFSPVARSVARVASNQMARSKSRRGSPPDCKAGLFKLVLGHNSSLSDSSEDEGFEGVVQTDFVFFDPKPDDFHGVKILLQTYLDDKQWDLSGFVDLILAQTTVGTLVKIEGDDDHTPFSVVSAHNLGRYKLKKTNQKRNANLKKRPNSHNDEEIIYIKPEDEIFHKLSLWSFTFPMRTQQVETQELKNYSLTGFALVVEAEKISTFRQQLQSLIDEF